MSCNKCIYSDNSSVHLKNFFNIYYIIFFNIYTSALTYVSIGCTGFVYLVLILEARPSIRSSSTTPLFIYTYHKHQALVLIGSMGLYSI